MAEENNDMVLSILENIKKGQENNTVAKTDDQEKVTSSQNSDDKTNTDNQKKVTSSQRSADKTKAETIRGIPKSGKFWKSSRERFSSINKTKGLRQDFQKKTALRLELQRTKELSKQVQEQIKQKELDRKERRRQNIKRTQENKQKAEVVQVITNTAKLKRMKKKQLRFIQKRDTNKEIEASK